MAIEPFAGPNTVGAGAASRGQLTPLIHVVYASRPFGFDDLALSGILATARRNNQRDDITGALICREDLFLQWLEGPEPTVMAAFERIARDDRHTDVTQLIIEPIAARVFPDWAMRHDPARSWMWTPQQVSEGIIATATADHARDIFLRLAEETHNAQQNPAAARCSMTGGEREH